MNSINEVKLDIAEIESLLKQSTRTRIKELLQLEHRRLNENLTDLLKESMKNTSTQSVGSASGGTYQVQLRNYAWDQTANFVKLYVTLPKVHTISAENVYCKFLDEKSFELHVKNLENKDYVLTMKKLLDSILAEKSTWKVKNDMVIVSLAKQKSVNWSHLTELEKKASDAKASKFDFDKDDSADPSASLMNMVKNLYNSGDDELKRTIEKSWVESSSKRPF